MAGFCSCFASSISYPTIGPPTSPFKSGTKISQPSSSRFHGLMQYPCHRVSAKLARRLERVAPLRILGPKPRCYSSNINNPGHEFIDNSSRKSAIKNWISQVKKIAHDVLKPYREPWVVPWGAGTVFLFLYLNCAWKKLHDLKIAPLLYRLDTAYNDSLWTMSRDPITIAILYLCLYRFRHLPPDCLRFSLKGNWKSDFIIACLHIPLKVLLYSMSYGYFGVPTQKYWGLELGIKYHDYTALALETFACLVCAPVCEEIVYRGFLIPSLTRYIPLPISIVLTSIYFAEVHNDRLHMLGRLFAATIYGVVFARSRNMLPSVLLHMLWNMYYGSLLIRYYIGKYW